MASPPAYPAEWEADVLLGDGHPVHLRPITPADGAALRRFHSSLSDLTVYFRFFAAKPDLTDADVERFTHVDHVDRVALIALDGGDLIGVGRYDALGDGSAEVAFVIRDDVQGRGLGSVLLEHLAAAARERGLRRFVAEVLPQNARMLATFREAGYAVDQRREDDVIALSFDIEPTVRSLQVMAARESRAEARSVHRLLHPRSVAVVGVSRTGQALGNAVLRHLVDGGFAGELLAVHREADAVDGVRCVRSLADAGTEVDLAVVVVPAVEVPGVIDDAATAGVHGLVVVSGGFGDAEGDGPRLQRELVAVVRRTGMRLVGPNALGIINTDPAVRLNASLVATMPDRGSVGFFSQSGALGGSILARMADRGLGVSTFVSAGNRADISGNDLLQFWDQDPDTSVVLLHLETIGNARKFARIVRRMAEGRVVAMVRVGAAGARHPLGHLVSDTRLPQRAVDEILGDTGLVVVDSIDRMLDVATIASRQPLPRAGGLRIVGNSDALAVLAVNAARRHGLAVAGDPVTLARQESVQAFESAIRDARSDVGVGAVLAIHVPPIERSADADIRSALAAAAAPVVADGPPVVLVLPPGHPVGPEVPVVADVEEAVAALATLARLARWRAGLGTRPGADEVWPGASPLPVPSGVHGGQAALDLLGVGAALAGTSGSAAPGWRVRIADDPVYGAVVRVSVDHPVAEALTDASWRLAPVTAVAAGEMLASLGAGEAAVEAVPPGRRGEARAALAALVCTVSERAASAEGAVEVDLRGVRPAAEGPGLTVESASVTVATAPPTHDAAARRL